MQADVCCGILTEGQDALARERGGHAFGAGVVTRDHDELGRGAGELHERSVERLVRSVVVEVIGVDVGDEGHCGVVEQEGAV